MEENKYQGALGGQYGSLIFENLQKLWIGGHKKTERQRQQS